MRGGLQQTSEQWSVKTRRAEESLKSQRECLQQIRPSPESWINKHTAVARARAHIHTTRERTIWKSEAWLKSCADLES